MTKLCRDALREAYEGNSRDPNVGLLLRRGLLDWQEAGGEAHGGGEAKEKLLRRIADVSTPEIYKQAFSRWQRATADSGRFCSFTLDLVNRMYIGLNRDSALETGVTVQHTYGMPMIPGSAVKGLARSCFSNWLGSHRDAQRHLFGNDYDAGEFEAGGVVFHDAWWVPGNIKPFVKEIVTPHHGDYYGSEGKLDATDFDSPIPVPQLAVQGSFHFTIEGASGWRDVAAKVLKQGLTTRGIGGKRSSGYGFFKEGP